MHSDLLFKNKKNGYHQFVEVMLATTPGINKIDVNPYLKSILLSYDTSVTDEDKIIKKMMEAASKKKADKKSNDTGLTSTLVLKNPRLSNGRKLEFKRMDDCITCFKVVHSIPGRIRTKHFIFKERPDYIGSFEKKLMSIPEFKNFSINKTTASVLVVYDFEKLNKSQVVRSLEEILNAVIDECKGLRKRQEINRMAVCSGVMAMAAVGDLLFPWLMPINLALIIFTAFPIFKDAWAAIRKKQIKVDILDATVVLLCLIGNQIFAAAFMVWIVGLAKSMLDRTTDESKKLLSQIFSSAPRFAWINKDGVDVQCPVEKLMPGDEIIVYPGEIVPVDGVIAFGDAMIDQHSLTGESAPVEKKAGDKVFASTMSIAGKIIVSVEEVGENTKASKIVQIIEQSVNHKTKVHSIGERLADKMVLPTLGLAAVGSAFTGFGGILAIVNCDYGTGIRISAPLAVLSSVANAAKNGILIKNSKALEDITKIDAVLFDKTGTLTHETPEVANIIKNNGYFDEKDILLFSAAAEQKFSHPIAKAILKKASESNLKLPKMDESKCKIGYGIEVGINGDIIKVGSIRYMNKEGIKIPSHVEDKLQSLHKVGGSAVMVAVNDYLAGALELRSSNRPEAVDIIQNLRKRGVKEIVLISGDHDAATRHVAETLGMDRHFSEVLPQDKANYVKLLQSEGKKVAFVGDGINDSVALSLSDVSISLRGASDIATDVADIVFMDGNLSKFDMLFDISRKMQRNISRSFAMIVIANTLGIAGAMTGVVGLFHSLILNNGVNIASTINGMLPFYESCDEDAKHKDQIERNLSNSGIINRDGNKILVAAAA